MFKMQNGLKQKNLKYVLNAFDILLFIFQLAPFEKSYLQLN
jgi:hypothetical protein